MLALLLPQVLGTIRHSREIIITDAVGAGQVRTGGLGANPKLCRVRNS